MKTYKRSYKNYLIDKRFQTKYLILTILLLLFYTFIFTAILFFPSVLTLYFDSSLADKNEAARTFLILHGTVWPTTAAVILIFSIVSIFLTHKIAGPVYRLKYTLTKLNNGNLDSKINLRKWDDLQELATQVNLHSDNLSNYVLSLKKHHEQLSNNIDQLKHEMSTEIGREIITQLQEQNKSMAVTLNRFTTES